MFAVGNIPNSDIEQFHDFWKRPGIFIKAKHNYRKIENGNKKRGCLPGSPLTWPNPWLGRPTWPCESSPTSASRQRRETAHVRPRRHAPPCSPVLLRPPRRLGPSPRHRPDPTLLPSLPVLIPSPGSLSLTHRAESVAAVHCHRVHQVPLAPLFCPTGSPRCRGSPRRSTRLRDA